MAARSASLLLTLLLLLAGRPGAAQDAAVVIRLASLEWPPYTSARVAAEGASAAVVRAALATQGAKLEIEFMPWTRAVAVGQDGRSGFHGYFPEYQSVEVERTFRLSRPIGSSPLGFVERRSSPVRWRSLDDLREVPFGVVRGYVNTAELDARIARGELTAVPAGDDLANLRKVMRGRLDLAVIDRHVLDWLAGNEPSLADARRVVQFNARGLEDKVLYVALQRSPHGERARKLIDAGLQRIDIEAIVAPFLAPAATP